MAVSVFGKPVDEEIATLNGKITKYVNVPYSDFSWVSQYGYYVKTSASPANLGLSAVYGFLVYCTNGGAVMGVRYRDNSEIQVHGIIPTTGAQITNSYEFVCYAVGKE